MATDIPSCCKTRSANKKERKGWISATQCNVYIFCGFSQCNIYLHTILLIEYLYPSFPIGRFEQVGEWIGERIGRDVNVEGVTGKLDTFIIEPFLPHNASDEYYICIQVKKKKYFIFKCFDFFFFFFFFVV